MDNTDIQVLRQLLDWQRQGRHAVLGTITRTWGSAPRPVGALVGLRDDGQIAGSVSGGCIEDDLIERIRSGTLAMTTPQVVRYGVTGEEAARFGLPCGGTIELVLEPLGPASRVEELLERLAAGQHVERTLIMASGAVQLREAAPAERVVFDGRSLVSTHGPSWRLLIIGAGQLAHYLAEMALALDYRVQVCDPREEHAASWSVTGCPLLTTMPDDTVQQLCPDVHTAIIALTHDPKLDDLALMEALRSPAFYVGAIGSRLNQARRKARLSEHFGLTEAELARLHGPVGIRNGARTPPEIAVAILAELTAARHGWHIPDAVRLAHDSADPNPPGQAGCAA